MDDGEFFSDVAVSGYTPPSNKTLLASLFPPTLGIIRLLNFGVQNCFSLLSEF